VTIFFNRSKAIVYQFKYVVDLIGKIDSLFVKFPINMVFELVKFSTHLFSKILNFLIETTDVSSYLFIHILEG